MRPSSAPWFSASVLGACLSLLVAGVAAGQVRSQLVLSGLDHPVAFVQDPSQANVQFIVEQRGHIRALVDGVLQAEDFLDLSGVVSSGLDGGVLGLAFAPDYAASGRFFVHLVNADDLTVIARFVRADALHGNPDSRFDLVWPDGNAFISQPECCHYGGSIAFGPDGYLYFGLGDGGESDDPYNLAQNPESLLGKIIRIDVSVGDDDPEGYDVPATNPFVDQVGVLPEIWAFGVRNPWQISFDEPWRGGTGALIISDVGQTGAEEWNYEPAGRGGRNYGWRVREGGGDHITTDPAFSDMTDPTYAYGRDVGKCIIGGFVYRGSALGSSYYGRYFFGDFMVAGLWSAGLAFDESGEAHVADLTSHQASVGTDALSTIDAFGQDAAGELYFMSWIDGTLYKLVPDNTVPPPVTQPLTPGDVDGDGKADLIFQDPYTGKVLLFEMDGTTPVGFPLLSSDTDLLVAGTADFTGDGKTDLVMQDPSSGQVVLWAMNGTTITGATTICDGTVWRIVTAVDLTGDGKPDLLWQDPYSGATLLWVMNGATFVSEALLTGGTSWRLVGAADLTGDGEPDLLWQDPYGGSVLVWRMNHASYVGETFLCDGTVWMLAGTGDYTGDGKPDLVWQDPYSGGVLIWVMNGETPIDYVMVVPGTVWRLKAPR